MDRIGRVVCLLIAACTCGCATVPMTRGGDSRNDTDRVKEFVKVSGMDLVVDGRPWRFTGYNFPYVFARTEIPNCTYGYFDRYHTDIDEQLARFEKLGVKVIRAWAFQSFAIKDRRIDFTFFDAVIAKARARGIRIIMVIGNGIPPCEPQEVHRPLEWYSPQPAFPGSPFYRQIETGHVLSYRDYALTLAAHFNDEPAVAWWELLNEPAPVNSADSSCSETIPGGIGAAQALHDFADGVASAIKSVDANHLVSIGTYGSRYQCGQHVGAGSYCAAAELPCRSDLEYVHSPGAIDLVSIHEYGSMHPGGANRIAFLTGFGFETQDNLDIAASLKKPIYIGETGITGPPIAEYCMKFEDTFERSPCHDRAACFDKKLNAVFSSKTPVAGVLIWHAVAGTSNCYDVGHVGGPEGPWDPVDIVVKKFADGKP